MTKVLIVEDELIPASYLRRILQQEAFDVVKTVMTGRDAVETARMLEPDIVLMDIMLEDGMSGTEAAMKIRQLLPDVIVIFLTAYSNGHMIEEALDSGAYAYMVKPYRDREIIATMKMAQKRCAAVRLRNNELRLVGGYVFDRASGRLFKADNEVELGPRALALLALLCQNPGVSLSHVQIMHSLWETPVSEQTLRSLVHRIRQTTDKRLIYNVSKSGYRIGLEAEKE